MSSASKAEPIKKVSHEKRKLPTVKVETLRHLDFITDQLAVADLDEWEKGIVLDRFLAFCDYGGNAVVTAKQKDAIEKIYFKIKFKNKKKVIRDVSK